MYAVGHTSHSLISLSDKSTGNVREKFKGYTCKKHRTLFGRCAIEGEVWSFFEEYEDAKVHQALLFLDGGQG